MPNLEPVQSSFPHKRRLDVGRILFEDIHADFNSIELIITVQQINLNIKEFSSYLDLIYRTDGSLSKLSFLSYSKMPKVQLEISQMRQGSWEIIIEKAIDSIDGQNLIILFLVLKFLPNAIKNSIDGAHKYYEMLDKREDYLEKKSKRKFRSPLKRAINEAEIFANASQKERDRIYKMLIVFYKKKNFAAIRFSKKYVKNVQLKPKEQTQIKDS